MKHGLCSLIQQSTSVAELEQTYLVELILASLGVKDGWSVPVVKQMSCGDKAIPASRSRSDLLHIGKKEIRRGTHTIISRPTRHQDSWAFVQGLDTVD